MQTVFCAVILSLFAYAAIHEQKEKLTIGRMIKEAEGALNNRDTIKALEYYARSKVLIDEVYNPLSKEYAKHNPLRHELDEQ